MYYNNTDYNQFLIDLDKSKIKTKYARITALKFDESPIETIEGRVTQGSINLDGDSAVRRTCSLTIVANDFDYSNYVWGLNTKFKLEIGLKNEINAAYPDIIWFNQGKYLISSFNMSRSTNSFTISLQGKDKMCQLNGEVGGSIGASIDFGTIQEIDAQGNSRITKIPIQDIIRNIVHQYAGEPLHNIIIKDIEDYGLELLEYRYDVPAYLYRKADANTAAFMNIIIEGNTPCLAYATKDDVDINNPISNITKFSDLGPKELDMLVDTLSGSNKPAYIKAESVGTELYHIAKIEYGQTAGYRKTDLTYPGDLIANVGETVTSILDKIKNMLGDFEYFYNLDGQFVFQKKQSFINTKWSPEKSSKENNEKYVESLAVASSTAYTFSEGELISAFNNNPNLINVRNDYSIWGERNGISGAKIPVHMRYAIDEKPIQYTTIGVDNKNSQNGLDPALIRYNTKHGTNIDGQISETYSILTCDWREIIYRMAQDFYKYAHILDDFNLRVIQANSNIYPTGQTGYEHYYIDILSKWRELYDPEIYSKYTQVKEDLDKDPDNKELIEKVKLLEEQSSQYYNNGDNLYWNKNVYEHPELLNFWFDFMDPEENSELEQFNVKNIGLRTKTINDTNIKSIYFRETPSVIFVERQDESQNIGGYKTIQIPDTAMFSISSQGQSAKDKLDSLIYQHGYCCETATITTIPIYYLQPNIRVYVFDEKTKLNGDYIISKISIPLAYNGTMSLTATKAAETLF